MAPNKLLAKMASEFNKPNGISIVREADLQPLIWPLPCRKINGIGPKLDARLQALGIRTIGELAARERLWLMRHFAAPDMELAAALDRSDSPALGTDAGAFMGAQTGVTITDRTDAALAGCQVLIDFTRPEASMAYLDACRQHGVKMVIGTTGFSTEQRAHIQQAAQDIAIVQAANMSPGVNAAIRLIELATQMLADTDIEVIEAHHRHKVDAPSGTALAIGEAIAAQLGKPLAEIGVFAREGHTGPRQPGSIGVGVWPKTILLPV